MQTDLKSDGFCSYNQEAAPFFWTFQPDQYKNTYTAGEIGVPANGGSAGSYIRADVIDISSFLSGRNDILSKCNPPVPSLDSLRQEPLQAQPDNTSILLPKYTKNLRSENNLDVIDYNRWNDLYTDAQNLRFVIEDFAPIRGGLSTQQFAKNAWTNQNNVPNFDKNLCRLNLDPSYTTDPGVSGYPGVNPLTGELKSVVALQPGKPPGQPNYPFIDITSQQVSSTNNGQCGPNFFYGPNYDKGSCPTPFTDVLNTTYR